MKIGIPVDDKNDWDSAVGYHFGKVPFFAIWDEETDKLEIIDNTSSHRGGQKLPPEFLADKCNVMICGGIGSRAIELFNGFGIRVFMGAEGTVKTTIEAYKKGLLKEVLPSEGCQH